MGRVKSFLLILLCNFVGGLDYSDDEIDLNHLDELLSLSELPLQKLLHVKRTFEAEGEENSAMVDAEQDGNKNPAALPLTASGGKSRRVNPLLQRARFRTATRRGGKGGGGGGWMDSMEMTKKADPSSIFQTSITTLSFLAFGGYLLCLIVQAIRAKEAAADGDFPEEPQRVVIIMQRPNRVRQRRTVKKRGSPKSKVSEAQKKKIAEGIKASNNEVQSSTAGEEADLSFDGGISSGNEKSTKMRNRPSNSSIAEQSNDYNVQYWPMANVDAMYRALIMIAEGYSMYHHVLQYILAESLEDFTKIENEQVQRRVRHLIDTGAVVAKVREGLDMAGKFLGLDTARGVAQLVSSSFMKTKLRQDSGSIKHGLFSGFFRLLGLDSTKLGAIALNTLIFIAQLISNSLIMKPEPEESHQEEVPRGSPVSWILDNPAIQGSELLQKAQDGLLTEKVIRDVQERHGDEESGCIQLLICKSSPFVWGMQRSLQTLLSGKSKVEDRHLTAIQRMYQDMPSLGEVTEHGDHCEEMFPRCTLLPR